VHVRLSAALVPAVLLFENPDGHALLPLFVTQVWSPELDFDAQLWVELQPAPVPVT
jgi:hypothetical protein